MAIIKMQTTINASDLEECYCPTCGSSAERKLIFKREDGIGFFQCQQCDLQYASPRYTESALLNLYEGENWQKNVARFNGEWNYQQWKIQKQHPFYLIQQNIGLVNRYLSPPACLLDVGCNAGLTVKGLEEAGYCAEGVEPSTIGADIARNRTGITVHNMELGQLNNGIKYNGILMLDVLEHLYNPVKVLEQCNQRLQPGGFLFLHVPHHKGISNRYKQLLHKTGIKNEFKHFGFPAHIYSFDKHSLQSILKKTGFDTIHFESWPSALTNGKVTPFNFITTYITKKFSLSDYIISIAKKV